MDLTLKEVKKLKLQAEEDIKRRLQEFMDQVGMDISHVGIIITSVPAGIGESNEKKVLLVDVRIEVSL